MTASQVWLRILQQSTLSRIAQMVNLKSSQIGHPTEVSWIISTDSGKYQSPPLIADPLSTQRISTLSRDLNSHVVDIVKIDSAIDALAVKHPLPRTSLCAAGTEAHF